MAIVYKNLVDGGELTQARRKVLRTVAVASLVAVAPAVLIVAALELARVDFSGPLGGLGGRFVEFPDGRIVAVQQWRPVDQPDDVELRGDFHFEVRGERRGGGFTGMLPRTSTR